MKKKFRYIVRNFVLYLFSILLCQSEVNAQELVIFSPSSNSQSMIFPYQNNGTLTIVNGELNIENTPGKNCGFTKNGQWDFRNHSQILISLKNYSNTMLRINILMENPNSDSKTKNLYRIGMKTYVLHAKEAKEIKVDIPRRHAENHIVEELKGMQANPFGRPWATIDLDPTNVVKLSIYANTTKGNEKWGIRYIKAISGENILPSWMNMTKEQFFPFVDVYGQFKHKDWPAKVYSDEDLKKNLEEENVELTKSSGPMERDKYGGWKNGPKQEAKGYFYVKKIDGKWWMVDPDGYLFWSHGVVRVSPSCGITPLDDRKNYFENLPSEKSEFGMFYKLHDELLYPYYVKRNIKETYNFSASNIKRKYGDNWQLKFADMCHRRLKSWGLNTIANSSERTIFEMDRTPYCDRFEIKSPAIEGLKGLGWWDFRDPFNKEFRTNIHKQLLEMEKEINDPWCLGLFVDNELHWGNDTHFGLSTVASPASQPAKRVFQKMLKKKYGDIRKLNEAWSTNYINWNDFLKRTDKPDVEDAHDDLVNFADVIVENYFKTIKEEFMKVAPHKLYMGCRFAGSASDRVLRIASKYVDVMSYNIYTETLDYLKLPEGVDKPIMIGEFHFGALDRGMFHPGQWLVKNQIERGEAYKTYVISALKNPAIIGTHWHQFSDQMVTGRFDGECFQVGFTDICDTPYPETISKVREVGYDMYNIRMSK